MTVRYPLRVTIVLLICRVMMRTRPDRTGLAALRLAVAMLILLAQSVGWAAAIGPRQPANDAFPICHSPAPDDGGGTGGQQSDMTDCAACVLCHAVGAQAVLPGAAPSAPTPAWVATLAVTLPPARAPPGDWRRALPYPTGPPILA